jgi:pilus assembly protein CpaB
MQNRRGIVFLILAVLAGLAAALLARDWLTREAPDIAMTVATETVVVAAVDLPAGTTLRERQFDVVEWPRDYLPSGVVGATNLVRDRVTKRAISAGEPLLESSLLPIGAEAGLHAMISRDRRAMSVQVDAVIGVAGWVKPGSRVDVLATLRRVDWERPLPFTKVILQDVKVLAIDQELEKVDSGSAEVVSVVTLEVTPEQAQSLAYAASEGSLQLALRNPRDADLVQTRSTNAADLIPVSAGPPEQKSEKSERPQPRPERAARPEGDRVEMVRGVLVSLTERLM